MTKKKAVSERTTLEWLRADKLEVDPEYQRPRNDLTVTRIKDDFDPEAFGTLHVSRRTSGTMVLLDGQQRWTAVCEMGWGDQLIPCNVVTGITRKREADLFVKENTERSKPQPVYIFNANVLKGDKGAIAVKEVLDARGLEVSTSPGINNTSAVAALMSVYEAGEDVHKGGGKPLLDATLGILNVAWPEQKGRAQGISVQGVALMLLTYGKDLDKKRLAQKLADFTPQEVRARAKSYKAATDVSGHSAYANVCVRLYNRYLKDGNELDADMLPKKHQKQHGLSGRATNKRLADKKAKTRYAG